MKRFYKLLIVLAAIISGVVIVYNVYSLFNPDYRTQIAVAGSIEEIITSECIVVRNEEVVLKESGVIVSSLVVDGERVSKGEKLADLYYGSVSPEVQAELREINDKLSGLEALVGKTASDNSSSLDSMLKNYAVQIVHAAHSGKGKALSKIRGQIDDVVNRRIASNETTVSTVMGELHDRRALLEQQITGEKRNAYATSAGLYFSAFDGYEGKILPEMMAELTPDSVQTMKSMKPDKNSYDATMKIADGYEWYIAFNIDEGKLPSLHKGKQVAVRFPLFGRQTYDVEIISISDAKDGQAVLVCRGTDYNDAVYYNRFLEVDVVLNSQSGLKVFKDAVTVHDNKTGVFVLKQDGVARFKEVTVLASDAGYAVLKMDNTKNNALLLYDEVLITKNSIEDGEVIK